MSTQTFPCPFCGKKMGVGVELLGKKVRCPHCNQILVAPAPAAAPPVVAMPTPAILPPLPTFNLPSQEGRESIFGETADESDEVFSSPESNKLRIPEMPEPDPPTVSTVPVPPPEVTPPPPPATSLPVEPGFAPTVELNENPFSGLEFGTPEPPTRPAPIAAKSVPPPAPKPTPAPAAAPIGATPPSSAGVNPWAGMDEVTTAPVTAPVAAPTPVPAPIAADDSPFVQVDAPAVRKPSDELAAERRDRPAKRAKASPATDGGSLFKIGFFILAPYALIVTIAAIYGLFLKSSVPAGHPLSNLPDNFGEFGPAERKKTGRLPAAIGNKLPEDQKMALGGKLEIGQLEIEAVGIEQRPLRIVLEARRGSEKRTDTSFSSALVLKLRIRNTSDDLLIHPLDPAFNRKAVRDERLGTAIVVGEDVYSGGPIEWPFSEKLSRQYEEEQAGEFTPLKPGETRAYVVCSDASQRVVKAVKDASDPVLWRVQVRRGRIDFDGKDIPVTAIIGVEFKPSDVKAPS